MRAEGIYSSTGLYVCARLCLWLPGGLCDATHGTHGRSLCLLYVPCLRCWPCCAVRACHPHFQSNVLKRLQCRRDAASKAERSLQQRRRAAFRAPEEYLATLRPNAAMHVGGNPGN